MREEWANIKDFGGHYEASSKGRIRVKPRIIIKKHSRTGKLVEFSYPGKELVQSVGFGGYLYVTLGVDGKTIKKTVHILVALAFHGDRPEGMVVCHNNGCATDNRPENLRWGTHLDNARDRKNHGRYLSGENHKMAKLNKKMIDEIRNRKIHYTDVVKEFGISRSQAWRITTFKSWVS